MDSGGEGGSLALMLFDRGYVMVQGKKVEKMPEYVGATGGVARRSAREGTASERKRA